MRVKFKWVALAAATLTTTLLAACGQSNFNTSEYNYVYTDDPVTFDYTATYRTSDSDHLSNFIDGLFERCQYGRLKPDMAKTWSVSDDGLTYTYKLRKGVKWADAQGKTYATVKAQDFVTGLKHAVRAKSETLYVVQDSIKGLADYVNGKTTDFNMVGVKALDDYTLQYTLNQPESYWNSKLTYGVMYPVNAQFLAEKQENFGRVSANGILYNGPYVLAKYKRKGVIQYKANPRYWDKKNVHIQRVTQTYNNGAHLDNMYKQFRQGKLSTIGLDPTTREFADVEKKEKDNIIWSTPDSAVFNFTFNLDRRSYNLTSKTTEKAKADTHKAIMNQDFRLAIQAAFDKTKYNAEKSGKEGGALSLRNMVTPYQFVQIDGHSYGEKVGRLLGRLNPALFEGVDLRDQQDGTYKPRHRAPANGAGEGDAQEAGRELPRSPGHPKRPGIPADYEPKQDV